MSDPAVGSDSFRARRRRFVSRSGDCSLFVFAGLLVQVALRVWVFGGPSYFPGGYPLVVRPIYQVTTDPETVHRLTVLVSAVVAAMLFPVLVAILRRFGLRPPIALVIAFALALLPATL